jgi:hypothetical protein
MLHTEADRETTTAVGGNVMASVPVNDEIRHRARELIKNSGSIGHRAKLRQIIKGEVKSIGAEWWREVNDTAIKRQITKIRPMTNPARNPNEHQRRVAQEMLDKMFAKLQASPPGLEEYDRIEAERFAAANTKLKGLFDHVFREEGEEQ